MSEFVELGQLLYIAYVVMWTCIGHTTLCIGEVTPVVCVACLWGESEAGGVAGGQATHDGVYLLAGHANCNPVYMKEYGVAKGME